jgi:hypothetical protein
MEKPKMGGTGNLPVPRGNLPRGMGLDCYRDKDAIFIRVNPTKSDQIRLKKHKMTQLITHHASRITPQSNPIQPNPT